MTLKFLFYTTRHNLLATSLVVVYTTSLFVHRQTEDLTHHARDLLSFFSL